MPLDPRAQRLLHMLSAASSARPETALDRRRSLSALTEMVGGDAPSVAAVEDFAIPSEGGALILRRYQPSSQGTGAIVFLHGGGWVAGGLDTHDGVCRRLANASDCTVFAVDYRLAPEHPFPAALSDALCAIDWVADRASALGLDPSKLVLAGDSAGGGLATAAGLLLRDRRGPPIALQVLICPILDLAAESPSRRDFAEGYFLSQETLKRDLADYVPAGMDLTDFRLSPLCADEVLGFAPTHLHVAEFDPFRDEGLAFADRLQGAGVPVSRRIHAGMIHYFYAMPGALPYADQALTQIGAAVKAALA